MKLPNQSKPVIRKSRLIAFSTETVNPSACVNGTINGNQACVDIPVFGDMCFTLPFNAPIGAKISACTCGSWIPTGANITVSAAGVTLWSKTIGSC
jgi:hypothetical protein